MIYRIEMTNPSVNPFGGTFHRAMCIQMSELGLPAPDLCESQDYEFWFTELGWEKFGSKITKESTVNRDYFFNKPPYPPHFLKAEEVEGIDIEVASLSDYGQSEIAYRDEYQIAFVLPRKPIIQQLLDDLEEKRQWR